MNDVIDAKASRINEYQHCLASTIFTNKKGVTLKHKELVDLLQKAYSAEKAAAFAYQGHAGSVKDPVQKKSIRQIELDEWNHRSEVLQIMQQYDIPVSKWYEFRFYVIGKIISFSCYIIGWFMPFYFAGSLESGNVCEYFRMKQFFNELVITKHDAILYEMGIKEKEHEVYFLSMIKNNRLLPFFEKIFNWGNKKSANNIDMEDIKPLEGSDIYCRRK
jgi:rubrerythrin